MKMTPSAVVPANAGGMGPRVRGDDIGVCRALGAALKALVTAAFFVASPALAQQIMNKLKEWTGQRWVVALSNEAGAQTIKEVRDSKEAEKMRGVRDEPLVRSVMERFPGAEIIAVRTIGAVEPVANSYAPNQANEDVVYADTEIGEDDEDL